MENTQNKKFSVLQALLWIIQGCLVGIGAILPGVSGGTLCYVFGIYDQVIEVLSSPFKGLKKHWLMLAFVGIGGILGFVGFAGVTEALLEWNKPIVLCVFIGLILGTVPELWRDSGSQGRNKYSIIALIVSFFFIAALFFVFGTILTLTISATVWGYAICGIIWGLSFIVPGFSSSTLLLFFGIYETMAAGIKTLSLPVILPLGITMLATLLLFSRAMRTLFDKYHSVASHGIMGFVLATTLMLLILPDSGIISSLTLPNIFIYLGVMIGGAVASFLFSLFSAKIRK